MYRTKQVKMIDGEDLLNWIFEHEQLSNDFLRHFNLLEELEEEKVVVIGLSEVKKYQIDNE